MKSFSYGAIPAQDFERAFGFYQALTEGRLRRHEAVPFPMAYFLNPDGRQVGHLFQLPGFRPSADGPIVYFDVDDLDAALDRITKAGGKVVMPKTMISPSQGHWALFLDTEGNRLALHAK